MSVRVPGTGFTQLSQSRILLQFIATIEGLSSSLSLQAIPSYDEAEILEALSDGVSILEALCEMEPQIFVSSQICRDEDEQF